MPRYSYRCPNGHITDVIADVERRPAKVRCPEPDCGRQAPRLFTPPAAIHFHGPGFYSTDVKGRVDRKRRPNPGDSLPVEHDHAAARIADGI